MRVVSPQGVSALRNIQVPRLPRSSALRLQAAFSLQGRLTGTRLLEPLPTGVVFQKVADLRVDIAHVFVTREEELAQLLPKLRKKLKPDAALWISWSKRAAKVPTTVSEEPLAPWRFLSGSWMSRFAPLRTFGPVSSLSSASTCADNVAQ